MKNTTTQARLRYLADHGPMQLCELIGGVDGKPAAIRVWAHWAHGKGYIRRPRRGVYAIDVQGLVEIGRLPSGVEVTA